MDSSRKVVSHVVAVRGARDGTVVAYDKAVGQLRPWSVDSEPKLLDMNGVKTVLLVDGDLTSLVANSERLQSEGFHVQTAEDGGEALFHLSALRIDVVVLDLVLPTFSGAEVFKRMRADERLKELPVVILSNTPADKRPKELSGPTQFLLKSETQFSTLLQTMQDLLQTALINGFSGTSFDTTFSHVPGGAAVADVAPARSVATAASKKTSGGKKPAKFFQELTAELPQIRDDCFAYIKAPNKPAGKKHLPVLCERLKSLETRSKAAGCARVSLLTKPFNALLAGIASNKASDPSPSILQTIAQALDCLKLLLDSGEEEAFESILRPQLLVVDDDPVSNEVNSTALQEADFDVTNLEDPFTALELLAGTPFDLIVLDVNMPQLSGFEVCEKLRRLPESKATPVLFLTAFSNFENRKKSVLSGGGDFITKPVSPRELALKAAIHLLKSILRTPQTKNVEKSPGSPAQRSVAASELVSATQSATSNLSSADSVTVPPAKVKTEVSGTLAMKNETTPAVDAKPIEPQQNGKATAKKDASLGKPKPGELKHAPKTEIPLEPNHALSTKSSTPLNMLANSETERATDSDRNRKGDNTVKETGAPIEIMAAASQPQNAAEKVAQCKQLEQELAGLLKSCAELQGKLANGEVATVKSQSEISELKERLSQKTAKLEAIKAEFAKDSTNLAKSESELREIREQLKLAQAAVKEKEDNYRLLEEELIPLRKFRDQLQQKQQQSTAELARVKAGLAQETAERAKSESELRLQLNAAKLAGTEAEVALKEKEENYKLLEEELAPLRKVREQFQEKQRQNVAELERSKAELLKASADRAKSESELHEQIKGIKHELTQTEAALYRARDLEKQMTALRKEHEQLQAQQKQTATELERSKGELIQSSADHTKSESELRKQLEAAKRSITETEAALKENENRARDLEKQMTALRKEHEQLQAQQKQTATELERSKVEATQVSADRAKTESELRAQLSAANQTVGQTEAALKESGKCARDLETQLSALRKNHENLEGTQRQTAAELEHKKTELTQAVADRAKSESELGKRLEASTLVASQTEASLKQKEASFQTLQNEFATLRQAHSELEQQSATDLKKVKGELKEQTSERTRLETECTNLVGTKEALSLELSRLRESLAASEAKTVDAEKRIKDGMASLASVTAELEKEREARQRVEERAESLATYLRGLYGDLDKELAKEPS